MCELRRYVASVHVHARHTCPQQPQESMIESTQLIRGVRGAARHEHRSLRTCAPPPRSCRSTRLAGSRDRAPAAPRKSLGGPQVAVSRSRLTFHFSCRSTFHFTPEVLRRVGMRKTAPTTREGPAGACFACFGCPHHALRNNIPMPFTAPRRYPCLSHTYSWIVRMSATFTPCGSSTRGAAVASLCPD